MSASSPLPYTMDEPPSTPEGHLNARYHEQSHGIVDSTAGGPQPNSLQAAGSPDSITLMLPVG